MVYKINRPALVVYHRAPVIEIYDRTMKICFDSFYVRVITITAM